MRYCPQSALTHPAVSAAIDQFPSSRFLHFPHSLTQSGLPEVDWTEETGPLLERGQSADLSASDDAAPDRQRALLYSRWTRKLCGGNQENKHQGVNP